MDTCCYRKGKLPKQNTKYIHKVKCREDRLLSVSLTPCHCFLEFPSNFCMNGLLWPQSNHPWTGNVVAFLGRPRPRRDPHFPSVWLPSFTARVGCRFRLGHDLFPHFCFPPSLLSPLPPPATVTLLWRFRSPGMGVGIWQGRWREGWGLFIWVLSGHWIRYRWLAVVKERASLYMPILLVICIAVRLCPPNRYPDFLSVCLDPR